MASLGTCVKPFIPAEPSNRPCTCPLCSKTKVSLSRRKLPHPMDPQDGRLDQALCKQLFF